MEKLFYEDQYIKEFIAEVIEVKEVNNQFHVKLDKTAFFPGGGGQQGDLGYLENCEVVDVYEEHGEIYHVTNVKPIKVHRIKGIIDWNRRIDGMQQHLGQHVLSGCFFTLFNANTVSVHVGKDISSVDIQGIIEEDAIRKAEKMSNEIIVENIEVEFLTPTKSEAKKLGLRRDLPKTNEQIRVVKIGDLDINACCGVHPKSTLALQAIKIIKWEKHKGNTRIYYLAGGRAVNDYFNKEEFSKKICKFLNCGESDAINSIKKLEKEVRDLKEVTRGLRVQISEYEVKEMIDEAEKVNEALVIRKIYENIDLKYASKLAEKLVSTGKVVVLLAIKTENRVNFIFASSKELNIISMSDLLKDAISLIDGRGGGNNHLAQGAGKNSSSLDGAIDYAVKRVKDNL